MAVNDSRSMNVEFHQGYVDRTYIQLVPDRGNPENPPIERLTWPIYGQAELHCDSPFIESHIGRSMLPREYKTANARVDAGFGQSDSDVRAI